MARVYVRLISVNAVVVNFVCFATSARDDGVVGAALMSGLKPGPISEAKARAKASSWVRKVRTVLVVETSRRSRSTQLRLAQGRLFDCAEC